MPESLEDFALEKNVQRKKGSIQKVAVIGCGSMGQEIARLVSQQGMEVIFRELSDERIREVIKEIDKQLQQMGIDFRRKTSHSEPY